MHAHFGAYKIVHDEKPEGKHLLMMSGYYLQSDLFLIKILIGIDTKKGCIINIKCKSEDKDLNT